MNINELHITTHQVSQQTSEEIKKGFVIRKKLLNRTLQKINSVTRKDSIQHMVFVGNRGSGKSTILNRIKVEYPNHEKFIAIYLPEEQPGLYRLFDVWLAVIEELQAQGHSLEKPLIEDYNADLSYLSKTAYDIIGEYLRQIDKQLILLIDNIDRVFKNIEEEKPILREQLQNHKDLIIIGASTEMSEDFWDYNDPFYQFFKIERLEGLSKKGVHHLLEHWSEVNDLPEVKNTLKENPGKIEAIRIMTGGNPRTMILFINMLVNHKNALGFDYLKKIIDKTTPIYQERLQRLSPQQRKIVAELAFVWRSANVEELVPRCLMSSKLVSAQLNKLVKARIIESEKPKKGKLVYRLKERLFNLYLIMTQAGSLQKKRAKYLTEFLEIWYDKKDIQEYYNKTLDYLEEGSVGGSSGLVRVKALVHSQHITMDQRDQLLDKAAQILSWSNEDRSLLPGKAQELHAKALHYFENDKFQKSIEQLLRIEQPNGVVYYNLGLLMSRIKNISKAENYYLLAIEKGDNDAMNNYALLLKNQERYEESENYYLLAIEKGQSSAMYNYAVLLQNQERHEESENYYLLAIEKGQSSAMNNYAVMLQNQERYEESENYYLLAIEKGHKNAMNNYAVLLQNQERYEESENYYLLAIEKGQSSAMNNYALLLENQERYEESETYYLLAIEKGHKNAMYNYAVMLQNQERYEESENYYLLAIEKGHSSAMYNYALLLENQERYEESENYYLLAIEKGHSGAMNNYALLLKNQERYEESENYYLLAIEKGHSSAMYNYALLLKNQERYEESENYYLLAIEKGHSSAMYNYALLLQNQERYEESETYYLLAIEKGSTKAIRNLTSLYYQQNNKSAAANIIDSYGLNNVPPEFANILNLWLGNLKIYQANREEIIKNMDESKYSSQYFLQALIHQQSSWVKNIFEENEALRKTLEPYYYTTLILDGQNDELEKIPVPMKEVVDDILAKIMDRRAFYYG